MRRAEKPMGLYGAAKWIQKILLIAPSSWMLLLDCPLRWSKDSGGIGSLCPNDGQTGEKHSEKGQWSEPWSCSLCGSCKLTSLLKGQDRVKEWQSNACWASGSCWTSLSNTALTADSENEGGDKKKCKHYFFFLVFDFICSTAHFFILHLLLTSPLEYCSSRAVRWMDGRAFRNRKN